MATLIVTVTDDLKEKVESESKEFGISQAAVVSIALTEHFQRKDDK